MQNLSGFKKNKKINSVKLHVTSLSHISVPWYYVSLCQRVILHPLILNAWLPTGHYEISSPHQLSSMSLEALNVALLQQAGLTFVPRSSPMPPGSPTVRRPKSRDLKPANPPHWWHLSCDIPPSPIHTRSKAAEKEGAGRAWDQGFGFFCGSVTFDWPNNATGGGSCQLRAEEELISGGTTTLLGLVTTAWQPKLFSPEKLIWVAVMNAKKNPPLLDI